MLLYWSNVDSTGQWDDEQNWFEDAAATIPHLSTPNNGDSCTLASNPDPNWTGTATPRVYWQQLDLGAGTCDIDNLVIGNYMGSGSILSGIFTGANLNLEWNSPIWGGIFTGANVSSNGANIYGGIFLGSSFRGWAGTIYGGTFIGGDFNNAWMERMQIFGGLFSAAMSTWYLTTPQPGFWLGSGSIDVDGYTVAACGETNPGFLDTITAGPGGSGGTIPADSDVRFGTAVGMATGTLMVPGPSDVRSGIPVDATVGMLTVPAFSDVRYGTVVDAHEGTCHVPLPSQVKAGVPVDASLGTLAPSAVITPAGASIELQQFCSYTAARGNALQVMMPANCVDLTGADVHLLIAPQQAGKPIMPPLIDIAECTVQGDTSAPADISVDIASAKTAVLVNYAARAYAWCLVAYYPSTGDEVPITDWSDCTATPGVLLISQLACIPGQYTRQTATNRALAPIPARHTDEPPPPVVGSFQTDRCAPCSRRGRASYL